MSPWGHGEDRLIMTEINWIIQINLIRRQVSFSACGCRYNQLRNMQLLRVPDVPVVSFVTSPIYRGYLMDVKDCRCG